MANFGMLAKLVSGGRRDIILVILLHITLTLMPLMCFRPIVRIVVGMVSPSAALVLY